MVSEHGLVDGDILSLHIDGRKGDFGITEVLPVEELCRATPGVLDNVPVVLRSTYVEIQPARAENVFIGNREENIIFGDDVRRVIVVVGDTELRAIT